MEGRVGFHSLLKMERVLTDYTDDDVPIQVQT